MKFNKLRLLILVFSFFICGLTHASHILGGEISYVSKGKNIYEIFFKQYRDCGGIAGVQPACTLRRANKDSILLTFKPTARSIRDITPVCGKFGPCYPANSIISGFGIEEQVYVSTVDLTAYKTKGWCQILIVCEFPGSKAAGLTTTSSTYSTCVVAMIDICSGDNNSPIFYSNPNIQIYCNQTVNYNFACVDQIDNDSLVYEITNPISDYFWYPSGLGWNSGFSAQKPYTIYCNGSCTPASPKSNPPSGIYLDRQTGDLIFTPTNCNEGTVLAVRVSEYRKDSTGKYRLIGYVTRDNSSYVSNNPSNNSPSIDGPDIIYFADSTESQYTFRTRDNFIQPSTGTPVYNDTVKLKMLVSSAKFPDSTFKTMVGKHKNPTGTFKLKPMGYKKDQLHLLILEARDNGCPYNIIKHKSVKVYIRKKSELAWVEGIVFTDVNKNCRKDSFESALPYAYVTVDSGKSIGFMADSMGFFSGWLPANSYQFSVINQFGANVCKVSLKLNAGKTHSLEIGGLPNMKLSGVIYRDSIANCKVDSFEKRLKNRMVYTEPGNHATLSDIKGQWELNVPPGHYKILVAPKRFSKVICPATPYTASVNTDTVFKNNNFAIFDSTNIVDLSAALICSKNVRQGSNFDLGVTVKNNGSKVITSAVLWVKFSKKFNYISSVSYSAKTDTTIKFSLPTLKPEEEVSLKTLLYADPSKCKLGDTMTAHAWLDTIGISKDILKANNADKKKITIVAAVDPNIKQEQKTNGYAYREGNKLRYFVQFQNTGTDTAVNIIVVDTLPYALLARSLVFNGASHNYSYSMVNNVLKVSFLNIYLPDTNTNKDNSIGYFDFSINIDPQINNEVKFYNQAGIYFDYASPVLTNKEYTIYTSLVKTGKTNKSSYCVNDSLKVSYNSKFNFNSGNKFKIVLSNSKGEFTSGTKLLDSTVSTTPSGDFGIKVPNGLVESSLYRVKVISTNPSGTVFEKDASNSFTILGTLTKPLFAKTDTLYCGKDSIKLKIKTIYSSFKLYDRQTLVLSNNDTVPRLKLSAGYHYYVVEAKYKTCFISSDTLRVYSEKLPVVKLSSPTHSILKVCGDDTVQLKASGAIRFDLLGNSSVFISSHADSIIKIVIPKSLDRRSVRGYTAFGCNDTSKTLTFIKYVKPTVSLSISDPDLEICSGYNVIYTGKGASSYQLYRNDTVWLSKFTNPLGSTSLKYTSKIKVLGTDLNGCNSFSNIINIDVIPLPDVKLSCIDKDLTYCQKEFSTFYLSGAATYKLYKNNVLLATPTSSYFSTSNFIDGDEFYVQGTSAKGCVANSNKIKLTVAEPRFEVKVANTGSICNTDTVFLNFTGGVSYKVFRNNLLYKNVFAQTLASLDFKDNDEIYVEGTDSFGCKANSWTITINLVPKPMIQITNTDTDNEHCEGETVNLNFSGGTKYDLYKNDIKYLASIGNKINLNDLKDADELYVIGFTNSGCYNESGKLKFTVHPKPVISISNVKADNSLCEGENVTINLQGGAIYDLYKNDTVWKPKIGNTTSFNDVNDADEIFAIGQSTDGCLDTSTKIKFTVWPIPTKPVITRSGNLLMSNYINGNQWYEGKTKISGANSQSFEPNKNAVFYVEHTDVNGCLSPKSDSVAFLVSISKLTVKGLKVYPNPANDYLIIDSDESGKYRVSLIDLSGKLIAEDVFIGNHFVWETKPSRGLYILKIINEKGWSEHVAVEFK